MIFTCTSFPVNKEYITWQGNLYTDMFRGNACFKGASLLSALVSKKLALNVNLETVDSSGVDAVPREAVPVVLQNCSNTFSGSICTFWAVGNVVWKCCTCVFIYVCTHTRADPFRMVDASMYVWFFLMRPHFLNSLNEQNEWLLSFFRVCYLWLQFVPTIDWPVNNRLVWPNNQCDGVTMSLLTDELLSQWVILCLFGPQNPKITHCLSPCFPPPPGHHGLPLRM